MTRATDAPAKPEKTDAAGRRRRARWKTGGLIGSKGPRVWYRPRSGRLRVFDILTLNAISPRGLARLPKDRYRVSSDSATPDAILVRSFNLHDREIPTSVRAIGRAGAGVNNIPVAAMSQRGIPVFNAPGANANAVKELVVAGLIIGCRHLCHAWDFARTLAGDDASLHKAVEAGKKQFVGTE